jgi:hypothetical protein
MGYLTSSFDAVPHPFLAVVMTEEGRRYGALHVLEWTHDGSPRGLVISADPPVYERRNACEHCGRADLVEVTCGSFEELVERGWLVPLGERA